MSSRSSTKIPIHGKNYGKAMTRCQIRGQSISKIINLYGNIERLCLSNENYNSNNNESKSGRHRERDAKHRRKRSKEKSKIINLNNNKAEVASASVSQSKSANEQSNTQTDKSVPDLDSETSKTSKLSKSEKSDNIEKPKLTITTNPGGNSDISRGSVNLTRISSVSISADKEKSKSGEESSAYEKKDKARSAKPSAISKSETSVKSAASLKPETSAPSAAFLKPETSAQSAALSKPKTSAQSAALSKPKTSAQSTALSKPETSAQSAALLKPETSAQSAALLKPETSAQSAALSKPETSAQSAALSKPKTSAQSAALLMPETSAQSAALSKPETSAQSAALSKPETSAQSAALLKPKTSAQSAALSKPETSVKSAATPSDKGSRSVKEKSSEKSSKEKVEGVQGVKENDPLGSRSNVYYKFSTKSGKGEKKMRNYGDKYDNEASYYQIMLTDITQELINAKCLSESRDFSKEVVDSTQRKCIMCDKTICDVDLKNKETGKCMYCDPSIKRENIQVTKTKEKFQVSSEYRNNAVRCADDSECHCKIKTTFKHSPSFLKYQDALKTTEKPPTTPTEMLRSIKSKPQPMKQSFSPIDIASINKQIESLQRPIDTTEISAKIELSRSIHQSISPANATSQSFKSSAPPNNRMSKSFKSSLLPANNEMPKSFKSSISPMNKSSRSIRQTMSPSYIMSKNASIRQSMQTKQSNLKSPNMSARMGMSPYSSTNNSSNSRMLYADVLLNKSTNSATDYYSPAEKLDDSILSPNPYTHANVNSENLPDYMKINSFTNENRVKDAGQWSRADILKSDSPKIAYKQKLYPSNTEGRTKSQNHQSLLESQRYKGIQRSTNFLSPIEKKNAGILKNKQCPTLSNYYRISDTNCSNQSNSNLLMHITSKSNSFGDVPLNSFISPDVSSYQPLTYTTRNDSFGAMLSPDYLIRENFEGSESLPEFRVPTDNFYTQSPSMKNPKDKIKLVRCSKTLDENRSRNFNNCYKGQKIYLSDFDENCRTPVTNFKKNAKHFNNGYFAAATDTFCVGNLFHYRNSRNGDGFKSNRLSNFNTSSAPSCKSDFEKRAKMTPSNELINITTNFTSINDLQILNKLKINSCPNNIYNLNF